MAEGVVMQIEMFHAVAIEHAPTVAKVEVPTPDESTQACDEQESESFDVPVRRAGRRLAFPNVSSLHEIFERFTHGSAYAPDEIDLDGNILRPYCSVDRASGYSSLWVRPRSFVVDFIKSDMIVLDDHLTFSVVERADGTGLVTVKHSRILGDRWLAIVDMATVPTEDLEPEATVELPAPRRQPARIDAPRSKLSRRQRELVAMMAADGHLARFTSEERIPDWAALKKVMVLLGGKWKSGPQAFEFDRDMPLDAMLREAVETGEVPDPRAAGFFETPREIGEQLYELVDPRDGERILEPNAGHGALADIVRERLPGARLTLVELLDRNREVLIRKGYGDALLDHRDFLTLPDDVGPFDVVIMNPPFSKAADVDHVTKALGMLRPGGRLAAVMSAGTKFGEDRKRKAFRALLKRHGGHLEDLPAGSFKSSGTGVNTAVAWLRRAA